MAASSSQGSSSVQLPKTFVLTGGVQGIRIRKNMSLTVLSQASFGSKSPKIMAKNHEQTKPTVPCLFPRKSG